MKKLLSLILIFIAIMTSALTPHSANAETKYLRVIDKSTPLFLKEDMLNVICYLPYTYYVALLEELDECYHVEVFSNNAPSIDGFVKKEQLYFDGLSVLLPCPNVTLSTIEYTPLFSDTFLSDTQTFIFASRNLSYYGYLKDEQGKYCYFVSYGNKLGYVKEESIASFSIDNHPNPLTFIKQEETIIKDTIADNPEQNTFIFRILVIVCLILAGIIALFVVIKPKKSKTKNYYEESEYE